MGNKRIRVIYHDLLFVILSALTMIVPYYRFFYILKEKNTDWVLAYISDGLLVAFLSTLFFIIFSLIFHKRNFLRSNATALFLGILCVPIMCFGFYSIFKGYVMTGELGATWTDLEILVGPLLGPEKNFIGVILSSCIFYWLNRVYAKKVTLSHKSLLHRPCDLD